MSGAIVGWGVRGGVAAAALATILGGAPGAAQTLTLTAGRSGSDLREYDSPVALGGSVSVPLRGWLEARLDAGHHADRQSWTRSTCSGLIPPDSPSCRDDLFTSSYSVTTVGIGPQVRIPAGRWSLEAAALWTRAAFDGVWTGRETGSTLGRAPREAHWGLSAVVGATVLWNEHWGATALLRRDNPQVNTCIEDTYDPYCGGIALNAVEVGITVRR